MSSIDFDEAIHYPLSGNEGLKTQLIGGGLPAILALVSVVVAFVSLLVPFAGFLNFLLLPFQIGVTVLWFGYFVKVARSAFQGQSTAPTFDDWGQIGRDGLWGFLVYLCYTLPGIVAFFAVYLVGMVAMFGSIGLSAGGGEEAAAAGFATMSIVMILMMLVLFVGGILYAAVVGYLFPISMLIYADEESFTSAFSLSRIKKVGYSKDYALPWVGAAVCVFGIQAVVWVTASFLIGYLLVPFLPFAYFFIGTAAFYAFGQVYADRMGYATETTSGDGPTPSTESGWNRMDDDPDVGPGT